MLGVSRKKVKDGREPMIHKHDLKSDDFTFTESSDSTYSDDGFETAYDSTRNLFEAAKTYLKPGRLFRSTSYLYAERKIAVFFLVHLVGTLIVWGHFALIKWNEQVAAVPTSAPSYLWKRVTPTMEFGAMHAILFTMALIPLTMCRLSIAYLSETVFNRYIPFNRALRMHIHLGYTMILTVVFATILFFGFFGKMCSNGEQKFCDLLTSEIMSTGYGILVSLIIVGITSYFRHRIPYEVFYIIHHLVFIMYAVTIAHTLDDVHRRGDRSRSQAFKWFSSTLLLYICDRAAMHINHRYRTRIVSASTVVGSDGSRMIMLKVRRPILFHFKPGQYAFLRVGEIDIHWHPFSIASDPASDSLEFCIEVFCDKSWTGRLWTLLTEDCDDSRVGLIDRIEVMGPYGTSLANTKEFSHGLVIGTGTGVVPVLSLFRQHIGKLMKLNPQSHFDDLALTHGRIRAIEAATSERKGSIFKKLVTLCCSRSQSKEQGLQTKGDRVRARVASSITKHQLLGGEEFPRRVHRSNVRDMKSAARLATRSIYGTLILALLPALGTTLIGLTVSWNITKANLFPGMIMSLQIGTVVFELCFAGLVLFVIDANTLLALMDGVFCLIAPFADWFWYQQYQADLLKPSYVTMYCLFLGYMVIRLWAHVVRPRARPWPLCDERNGNPLERLELVWVTRSATLVSELYPEISESWGALVDTWGQKHAEEVCRLSIYVTDKSKRNIESLQKELQGTPLYESGCIHFERPDFPTVIQEHTLELVCNRRHAFSLLAFCGSPELSSFVHQCKISNDMITSITGYKNHQMEYVSESYGGFKKKQLSRRKLTSTSSLKRLTSRRFVNFGPNSQKHVL